MSGSVISQKGIPCPFKVQLGQPPGGGVPGGGVLGPGGALGGGGVPGPDGVGGVGAKLHTVQLWPSSGQGGGFGGGSFLFIPLPQTESASNFESCCHEPDIWPAGIKKTPLDSAMISSLVSHLGPVAVGSSTR